MHGEMEQRVKDLLVDGLSNKEIAHRLDLGLQTVKWHIMKLYAQRNLHGMADHRRLIVALVKESLGAPSLRREELGAGNAKKGKHHGDHAAEL